MTASSLGATLRRLQFQLQVGTGGPAAPEGDNRAAAACFLSGNPICPVAGSWFSVLRSEDGSLQSAALGPVSRKHCDPEEVVLFLYWRQEREDPVPLCLMMGTPAVS